MLQPLSLLALASLGYAMLMPFVNVPGLQAGFKRPSVAATIGECDPVSLQFCVRTWNQQIGLSDSYFWQDVAQMYIQTFQYMSVSIDNFNAACQSRSQFYRCVGIAYPQCVNPFTVLNWGATDLSTPFEWAQYWNHLEFSCGGGYEVALENFACIIGQLASPGVSACTAAYNSSTTANPGNYCNNLRTYMTCAQTLVAQACGGTLPGWYICEDLRYGIGQACLGLRCSV